MNEPTSGPVTAQPPREPVPLPTPRVEPHLLDQQEDLYGKYLRLELIEYLRPEKAFDSPDDLVSQVKRDIERTRELLNHAQ